jgi:hypothetical protein
LEASTVLIITIPFGIASLRIDHFWAAARVSWELSGLDHSRGEFS